MYNIYWRFIFIQVCVWRLSVCNCSFFSLYFLNVFHTNRLHTHTNNTYIVLCWYSSHVVIYMFQCRFWPLRGSFECWSFLFLFIQCEFNDLKRMFGMGVCFSVEAKCTQHKIGILILFEFCISDSYVVIHT